MGGACLGEPMLSTDINGAAIIRHHMASYGSPLKSLTDPFQVGQYGECQDKFPNLVQVQHITIRLFTAVITCNKKDHDDNDG